MPPVAAFATGRLGLAALNNLFDHADHVHTEELLCHLPLHVWQHPTDERVEVDPVVRPLKVDPLTLNTIAPKSNAQNPPNSRLICEDRGGFTGDPGLALRSRSPKVLVASSASGMEYRWSWLATCRSVM